MVNLLDLLHLERIDADSFSAPHSPPPAIWDVGVALTSTAVHKMSLAKLQIFSLDHALWRHGEVNLNHWHFVQTDSPFSGQGRGLNRALIYDVQDQLIASATQKNLLRVRK